MSLLLSIIIPSVTTRCGRFVTPLVESLREQMGEDSRVELLLLMDNRRWSIGRKMNELTRMAEGEFIAGVGDDDQVTRDYVPALLDAIESNRDVDVIVFDHAYYQDDQFIATIVEGIEPEIAKGSEDLERKRFTRSPSNKMAVRATLAKGFSYPEKWHGEDTAFARWALPRMKKQYRIERTLYRYFYRMSDNQEGKKFRRRKELSARA